MNDIIGKGWKFPIRVNSRGRLSYSSGGEDIEEAIWIILSTAKGERVMIPEYGCGIHRLVFAPLNPETIGDIKYHVTDALIRWEPRIDVIDVRVEQDREEKSRLFIYIDYRLRANYSVFNTVYPFYCKEGGGEE